VTARAVPIAAETRGLSLPLYPNKKTVAWNFALGQLKVPETGRHAARLQPWSAPTSAPENAHDALRNEALAHFLQLVHAPLQLGSVSRGLGHASPIQIVTRQSSCVQSWRYRPRATSHRHGIRRAPHTLIGGAEPTELGIWQSSLKTAGAS